MQPNKDILRLDYSDKQTSPNINVKKVTRLAESNLKDGRHCSDGKYVDSSDTPLMSVLTASTCSA